MTFEGRSQPSQGIDEFLESYAATHLVKRRLIYGTSLDLAHSPPAESPRPRPRSSRPHSAWRPVIQQSSVSSEVTKKSRSLFDRPNARFPPSCNTSISEDTDDTTSLASDPASDQGQVWTEHVDGIFIPCEFVGYTNCERRFGIGQVEDWLRHVIGSHLQGYLPQETVCWFCDESKFSTTSNLDVDKEAHLRQRMYHIVEHLEDGELSNNLRIRPDFPFFDHLANHKLIPQQAIELGKQYTELPEKYRLPPDDDPPYHRPSWRSVEIENNRSGNRKRRGAQRQFVWIPE